MNCPKCGKELNFVHVRSQCNQRASIDEGGTIYSYGFAEVLATESIRCPHCEEDLTSIIREE